jgi:hypothetical protein
MRQQPGKPGDISFTWVSVFPLCPPLELRVNGRGIQ